MRISVIIPTFNEEKNIEAFLKQFDEQTLPRAEFELIVVDGESTDRTRELARKHADKVIIQKSKGIGGARNDGVEFAEAGIIATTDADVKLPKFWLERILNDFKDEDVVAVTGPDGPIERSFKAKLTYMFLQKVIHFGTLFNLYCTGGTNSAFRRDAFLRIGGYKSLPHSDDVEIAFRLAKIGRIVYDKELFVMLSVRRMEKTGYIKTLLTWLKGDLSVMLGHEIKEKEYARLEY